MRRRFLVLLIAGSVTALIYATLSPTNSGGGFYFAPRYALSLEEGTLRPLYPPYEERHAASPRRAGGGQAEGEAEGEAEDQTAAPDLETRPVERASAEQLPLASEEYLVYVDLEGRRVLSTQRRAFGLAYTSWGFANFGEAPGNLVVQAPNGALRFSLAEPGYPVGRGERFFLMHAGGHELSEYDQTGTELWTFGGVSPITAFDATEEYRAVGFLSGDLYLRRAERESDEDQLPSWERIPLPPADVPLVYDLSFGPRGESLLVRSGLGPQSVSFYDLSGSVLADAPRWRQEPPVPSMRPERLSLLIEGIAAVQVSGEVLLLDTATGELLRRYPESSLGDAVEFREEGLAFYLLRRAGRDELRAVQSDGGELYFSRSVEPDLRMERAGRLLIFSRGNRFALMEVGHL